MWPIHAGDGFLPLNFPAPPPRFCTRHSVYRLQASSPEAVCDFSSNLTQLPAPAMVIEVAEDHAGDSLARCRDDNGRGRHPPSASRSHSAPKASRMRVRVRQLRRVPGTLIWRSKYATLYGEACKPRA